MSDRRESWLDLSYTILVNADTIAQLYGAYGHGENLNASSSLSAEQRIFIGTGATVVSLAQQMTRTEVEIAAGNVAERLHHRSPELFEKMRTFADLMLEAAYDCCHEGGIAH